MSSTIRVWLDLTAADDGDAEQLWQDMLADVASDPKHRFILETRNWIADVSATGRTRVPARAAREENRRDE